MESQLELYTMMAENREIFKNELPEISATNTNRMNQILKDGALSHKTKRLIALAVALRAGCTGCIISQTKFPQCRLRFVNAMLGYSTFGRDLKANRDLERTRRCVFREHLRVEVHPFLGRHIP